MLSASLVIFGLAALVGTVLAVRHLGSTGTRRPPRWLGGLHGVLAAAAFGLLVFGLSGPARGESTGTESFGTVAAVMFAVAAALGAVLLAQDLRGRTVSGTLMGVHAMVAVTGLALLLAFVLA